MKLTDILKEITLTPMSRVFPPQYLDLLNPLTEFFAEGSSGVGRDETIDEEYSKERFEDYEDNDESYVAFKTLISTSLKGTYVTNDSFYSFNDFPCPGAPEKSYSTRIIINKEDPENPTITVSVPDLDAEGSESMGWFDLQGNYHPDVEHFDEEGNYVEQ
jgi:hypothetical protein